MPFVRVGETRLHYVEEGSGDPVVLLEGMGGDTVGWRRNIPHFAASGFRAVAFDFRGAGDSDKPDGPYSMKMFVEDTIGFLDAIGVEAAHLYGQSMGGFVALNCALDHPRRVRSLVLGCTHAGGGSVVPARPLPGDNGMSVMYARTTPRAHIDEDARAARAVPSPRGDLQVAVARDHDVAGRLGEIACPVLVVHGEDDRVVDVANGRMLAEGIPGAELFVVPAAGHLFHSEQAGLVDERIAEFLRSVSR